MAKLNINGIIKNLRKQIEDGANGLVFDPVPHTYTYKGKEMKSVSAMCEIFEAPFNSEYWARKKAEAQGVSVRDILESWDSISQKACDEGTYIHAYGEWNFYNTTKTKIKDPEIIAIDEAIASGSLKNDIRISAIDDVWLWLTDKNRNFRLHPVAAENRIVNPDLGYAGTFDLLFLCENIDGSLGLIIFDYKTNKNLFNIYRPKGGNPVMMQYPFHNMPDCNAAHYSCQLSLYQLGLQRITDIPIIGRVLFWVNPLSVSLIDANDPAVYREAHKRIIKTGEKSKWNFLANNHNDISLLKKQYRFSRINRFGMLKLPYLGDMISDALISKYSTEK